MKYQIKPATMSVEINAAWDAPCWKDVEALRVVNARPEGSNHRPETELKLQYDEKGLYGLFYVKDFYVKSVHTEFQASVCRDSCVEFFFETAAEKSGYFNLEMNAGKGMLMYYVRDNSRAGDAFADFDILPAEDLAMVQKFHTMPDVVDPEIAAPTEYRVGFHIPYALIQKYTGCQLPKPGIFWRMNVYKCGDRTSHPHWISWNPVRALNFHSPEDFGVLEFC